MGTTGVQPRSDYAADLHGAAPGHLFEEDSGAFIGPEDTMQTLREEHFGLVCSLVTIWFGSIVIAGCGFVLSTWLRWTGQEYDLSKPMVLWLPVAIIAATGPVWLPVTVWFERRHLRKRLALLAERDRNVG